MWSVILYLFIRQLVDAKFDIIIVNTEFRIWWFWNRTKNWVKNRKKFQAVKANIKLFICRSVADKTFSHGIIYKGQDVSSFNVRLWKRKKKKRKKEDDTKRERENETEKNCLKNIELTKEPPETKCEEVFESLTTENFPKFNGKRRKCPSRVLRESRVARPNHPKAFSLDLSNKVKNHG